MKCDHLRAKRCGQDLGNVTRPGPQGHLDYTRGKVHSLDFHSFSPYAVGENRLCLLTCGPLAAKGRTVEGESPTRPPTARKKKNYDGLFLHTKPRGVGVTDLSEESVFEAGRYAFVVWSRLAAMKKPSSSRLEGQERLGGA